ncbi:Nucleoporin NUP35 [Trichinella pseudospiralis]
MLCTAYCRACRRRPLNIRPATAPGTRAGVRHSLSQSNAGAAPTKVMERQKGSWTCVRTRRPSVVTGAPENEIGSPVGRTISGTEKVRLEYLPATQDLRGKGVGGSLLRPSETIARPAANRRDVGSRAKKENLALASMVARFHMHQGR